MIVDQQDTRSALRKKAQGALHKTLTLKYLRDMVWDMVRRRGGGGTEAGASNRHQPQKPAPSPVAQNSRHRQQIHPLNAAGGHKYPPPAAGLRRTQPAAGARFLPFGRICGRLRTKQWKHPGFGTFLFQHHVKGISTFDNHFRGREGHSPFGNADVYLYICI